MLGGKAYGQLAQILIDAEEAVYADNEQRNGGWRGERSFKLVQRHDESAIISSFYFQPSDGGAIPDFHAGQYITILLNIDGQAIRRNYSLSDAPGSDYLRISVKLEGRASQYLHDELKVDDEVQLLAPCGDFILRKNDKPLVLLTAGVCITPAISMLNTEANAERSIHFIHAALNSQSHAFKSHVDQLCHANNNISSFYVYSEPTANCQANANGFIDNELLSTQLPNTPDAELYLLGPLPFMRNMLKIAKQLAIPESQIHYEFFGPVGDLSA